jgi:hypothetical protein
MAGACGDDGDSDKTATDGGGGDAGQKADGGGGAIDGGVGTIDSGTPDGGAGPGPDASTAIADALDRTGVKASAARADIVFPIACKSAVVCMAEEDAAKCVAEVRAEYDKGVSKGYTDVCLDATLDLYSCFATSACAKWESECMPLSDNQASICPKIDAGT